MNIISSFVDGRDLILLHRTDDGAFKRRAVPARYDYFVPVGTPLHSIRGAVEGSYIRISCSRWDERKQQIVDLTRRGIRTFEGDISPFRRYISDDPSIAIAKPRRAYFDIETDSRIPFRDAREGAAKILCWCVIGHDDRTHTGMLEVDTPAAERALLRSLWQALSDYDQILAWNGDYFDFPVIQTRSTLLGCLPQHLQRWQFLDHMALFRRMNLNSADSGDEKQSMKLEDIGQAVVGHGKDDFDSSRTWEEWAAGGDRRARLLRYNVKDVRLMKEIEEATGYVDLFQAIAETTLVIPDSRGLKPTNQVDGFMLRLAPQRGTRLPTMDHDNLPPEHKFRGAFVMKPPQFKGVALDVHVCDFASLYPSVIRSWNISAETLAEDGSCRCPTTPARFRTDVEGMLPHGVSEMNRVRKHWRDLESSLPPGTHEAKDAARKSMGAKVATNSFYGVATSRYSRYYSIVVGEAITQTGAWLLGEVTIPAARARGWHVGYGDTDSAFVADCSPDEFREFVEWCNAELYPPKLKELGCVSNHVSLEYEKQFARVVFTAAKKYAGIYKHFKGKAPKPSDPPKVRGLEMKRGDAGRLARLLQEDVVTRIVRDGVDDPAVILEIIRTHRRHVLHDPLPVGDVQLSKSLSGSVDSYAAAEIPHVRVARILADRGEEVREGTRIFYVVANGGSSVFQNPDGKLRVIPASDYRPEPPGNPCDADRYHLWERIVWPPTRRFVQAAFPSFQWGDLDTVRPKVAASARKYLRQEERGQVALPGMSAAGIIGATPARTAAPARSSP